MTVVYFILFEIETIRHCQPAFFLVYGNTHNAFMYENIGPIDVKMQVPGDDKIGPRRCQCRSLEMTLRVPGDAKCNSLAMSNKLMENLRPA